MQRFRRRVNVMAGFVVIDFETYSPVVLNNTSVSIYARYPATKLWCAGWAYNNEPPQIWLPGDPAPEAIRTASTFVAHNAGFEFNLWRYKLTPLYGWPEVPSFHRWFCTMAGVQS